MIAIPRALARRFRATARRCLPAGRSHGPAPPLWVHAEDGRLRLSLHLGDVVLDLDVPLADPGRGTLVIPLTALAAFEGVDDEPVTLQAEGKADAVARWSERGLPRSATFPMVTGPADWPSDPGELAEVPPAFLAALHEAGRSAARERGRYAMDRVQVRGGTGEVVGTDAKQCLVEGTFDLPISRDLLLPAVPVFGSKELASERGPRVGLAPGGGWLAVVAGPWRVWLKHDADARFPDVHAVVPKAVAARLTFGPADAAVVAADLAAWPPDPDGVGVVTLDLGDPPCLRARLGPAAEVVERRLGDSSHSGAPQRLVLNRDHLARALGLGFREFAVSSPERPLVARDGPRLFVTASLDPKTALGPADPSSVSLVPIPRSDPMPVRDTAPPREALPGAERHADDEAPDPATLLEEAEAVRTLLTEAAGRVVRLVAALKLFKKERRALAAAFSGLRQLRLGR